MNKHEVRNLNPGIYNLYWKAGGMSLAAVGVTAAGGKWIAPTNWIVPTTDQECWWLVKSAVLLRRL